MKLLGRTDIATIGGVALALLGVILGLKNEGIQLSDIGQATAAFIVFFGTAGAVLISTPMAQIKLGLGVLPGLFYDPAQDEVRVIDDIVKYARAARLRGVVSLENEVDLIEDAFFRKGMRLAIDAVPAETIRAILDADIAACQAKADSTAGIYENAAGFAPTLGMAGAAIGLIQVMKHLDRLDQVGMGVAAAFVATIYGVLLANLVLLPIAAKLRARSQSKTQISRLIQQGVLSIAEGANPILIRLTLEAIAQIPDPAPATDVRETRTLTAKAR